MFIGPIGIKNLASKPPSSSALTNPIFGINQVLIDDELSALNMEAFRSLKKVAITGTCFHPELTGDYTRLDEILVHPPLYEAYPKLKELPVINGADLPAHGDWERQWAGAAMAYISGNGKSDMIAIGPFEKNKNLQPKPSLLHEIQHAIQDQEGYFAGALRAPDGDKAHDLALYYASPQEREGFNVEARVLGSKKIWFQETDPKSGSYPVRVDLELSPEVKKLLVFFLKADLQEMLYRQSLALKNSHLQQLSASK